MRNQHKIDANKLLYLKADSNYTELHFLDGRSILSGFTLKHHELKEEFADFIRVNRAYLLNPKYIRKFVKNDDTVAIKMSDGTQIKVSKRRMNSLFDN